MDNEITLRKITKSNHNWFKDFDPYNFEIPDEMIWDVIDFINVIDRAKIILAFRTKDEIFTCIEIMHLLSNWLESAYSRKIQPTINNDVIFSDTQAILECRKEVEITPIKGMAKKPTWPELLAAFALKKAIEGIRYWENKETFNKYAKDLAVSSVSAITAAELLNEPIKAGRTGPAKRKTLDHYNILKDKLGQIYWLKYSNLSNRKAALALFLELTEKEKLTFVTCEPEITIQKWIAQWKNSKVNQA